MKCHETSPFRCLLSLALLAGGALVTGGTGGCQNDQASATDRLFTPGDPPINTPSVVVSPRLGPLQVDEPSRDAAIWTDPTNPAHSLMFLSTTSGKIHVVDFSGELRQVVDLGVADPGGEGPVLGALDVRSGFRYRGESIDIVAGNVEGKLVVLKINSDFGPGEPLTMLADQHSRGNEISPGSTAFTLYKRLSDGSIYAIDQSARPGAVPNQYLFTEDDGRIVTRLVRTFASHSWQEGMGFVADDELGFLYLGEKHAGINKYHADPDSPDRGRLGVLAADDGIRGAREGLALYQCGGDAGYLILATTDAEDLSGRLPLSSRFMIYDRRGGNPLLKTFLAAESEHSDGFEMCATAVPGFPHGCAILDADGGRGRQYLVYDWSDIAEDDLVACPR